MRNHTLAKALATCMTSLTISPRRAFELVLLLEGCGVVRPVCACGDAGGGAGGVTAAAVAVAAVVVVVQLGWLTV